MAERRPVELLDTTADQFSFHSFRGLIPLDVSRRQVRSTSVQIADGRARSLRSTCPTWPFPLVYQRHATSIYPRQQGLLPQTQAQIRSTHSTRGPLQNEKEAKQHQKHEPTGGPSFCSVSGTNPPSSPSPAVGPPAPPRCPSGRAARFPKIPLLPCPRTLAPG